MNTLSLSSTSPTSSERFAVLVAHAGPIFAWFLAPLLVYLLKRGDSKYVEFHALQSLLWSLAGTLIALATCGFAIPIFLVWHVIAALKTADGRDYEYPVVGEIARGLL
jgi:uncharacterized Tic20 family protein